MAQRYTEEQKSAAVDRYFERRSSRAAIEELGYPSTTALLEWTHPDPARQPARAPMYSF